MLLLRSVPTRCQAMLPIAVAAMLALATPAFAAKCNSAGSSAATLKWISGDYAFRVSQIEKNADGAASWILGQFKADGQGHITNAIFDANGPSYNKEQGGALSGGSYEIGSDGRGELTLNAPGGAVTQCLAVAALKNGVAGNGQFVEVDASAVAHGVFYHQAASAATEASVKGSWAFGVQGAKIRTGGVITRQAAAGYLTLNGAGKVTAGELDFSSDKVSSGRIVNQYLPQASITGTYKVAANGRGTLALELHQDGITQPANFVFYMAGPAQMLLLESDVADAQNGGNGSMSGRALLRPGTAFSNASVSGNSVFISNGVSIKGNVDGPKLEAGILDWNKVGGTVTGAADVNQDGKVTLASKNSFTAHYHVDAEGRVTASEVSGGGNAPVFYLSGHNTGFGVQADTAVDAPELFDQTAPAGGFNAGSFSGGYAVGSLWYGFADQIAESGEVVANSATKKAAADLDSNQGGQVSVGDVSTVSFQPAANGRFILIDGGHPSTALYLVSRDLAFGIDISGDASQPLSEVDFFEQNP